MVLQKVDIDPNPMSIKGGYKMSMILECPYCGGSTDITFQIGDIITCGWCKETFHINEAKEVDLAEIAELLARADDRLKQHFSLRERKKILPQIKKNKNKHMASLYRCFLVPHTLFTKHLLSLFPAFSANKLRYLICTFQSG